MIPCNHGFNLASVLDWVKGNLYDKFANHFEAEIGLMVPFPSTQQTILAIYMCHIRTEIIYAYLQ